MTGSFGDGQFWTVPDVARLLERDYGVVYQSQTSYRTLLQRCGLSFQRPAKQYKSHSEAKLMDFEEALKKTGGHRPRRTGHGHSGAAGAMCFGVALVRAEPAADETRAEPWQVVFTRQAQKDSRNLASAGLRPKAETLLDILRVNPFQTLPPYEKLGGDLGGLIRAASTFSIVWCTR